MSYWFTADPHFGHDRIIDLCKRPFTDVKDMDRAIIDNINKSVKTDDYLYLIGDFCWGQKEDILRYRNLIRCANIVFIWGNHDKVLSRNVSLYKQLFISTHDLLDITVNTQAIAMCHYPILEWNKFFYDAWNLFGHVHGNLDPVPGSLSCDVGVDCHNYKPVSFEELGAIMQGRKNVSEADITAWVNKVCKLRGVRST